MEDEYYLTTQQASEKSGGLVSSQDFARLARRGILSGAKKNKNIWYIPVASIDKYISIFNGSVNSTGVRIVHWWERTSRVPFIAISLFLIALLANSIDFFVNFNSVFDILAPGTTLFIDKAKEDEILILVAEFSGQGDYDPTTRIYRSLDEAIKREGLGERENLRVEVRHVPNMPEVKEDAIKLGSRYRASIVIWGTYDQAAIEPNVEVLRPDVSLVNIPEIGMTINQNQQAYNLYIARGLPNEAEYVSFLVVAKSHFYLSEYESAIDVLTAMLNYDLSDRAEQLNKWYIYALRGNAYQILNDFENAKSDYLAAIDLDPNQPGIYINLSALNFQINEYEVAIEICNKGLELFSEDPLAWIFHFTKGTSYHKLGHFDDAIEEFSVAIEQSDLDDPSAAIILASRGDSFASDQQMGNARNDYNASKMLFPENPSLYHNWGNSELEAGNPQEALEVFNLSIELDSENPKTFQLRGVAHRELLDYEKARKDFEYVISIAPDYGGGYYERGVLERLEENYEAALADIEKTIEIWPDNVSAHRELLLIYMHYDDRAKVIDVLTDLIQIDEQNVNWILLRAEMFLDISAYDNARTDYLTAQAVDPHNYRIAYGLGVITLFNDMDAAKAIKFFDQAVDLDNQIQDPYVMRGVAYGLQGDYQAASRDCNQFNEMRSTDTGIRMGTINTCTVFMNGSVVFVGLIYDNGLEYYYGNPTALQE